MSEKPTNKLSVNVLIAKVLSGIHSCAIQLLQVDTNPIKLNHQGTIYNIYLRNVSHAGKSYPENSTRAQLPKHASFGRIKASDERFLFMGYANDSDTFVCWDPVKAKSRLNKKDYVSFFSRKSIQDSAEEGEIKKATLSNGDVFVAFKRTDFEAFLNIIEQFFPALQATQDSDDSGEFEPQPIEQPIVKISQPKGEDVIGVISKIENDPSIQILVDSMFAEGQSAISISAKVMKHHSADYPNMQFKDWGKVIRKYLESKNIE